MDKLYIVGFGPGDENLLTEKAKTVIDTAERIISLGRLSSGLSGEKNVKRCSLTELGNELAINTRGTTVVLVSGDCCFFSASKSIVKDFSGLYDIELINGISSIQYFSSKLSIPYDDAVLCSMHGRNERLTPKIAYNKKVFLLTGGANRPNDICKSICQSGLPDIQVIVGERLSYPDERIVKGTAKDLKDKEFDELSVMYIDNAQSQNPHLPLRDIEFIRGGVPMTKEEVRWLSVQKLLIEPSDVIYDIGAGTGSVAVEMARRAFDGIVYAIEISTEGCGLITSNKLKHGAYNLEVINAKAPEGLTALPKPDKAFIGGSSGNMIAILTELTNKNPYMKVVSTAVTLQSINLIIEGYKKAGLSDIEIICVNIAKSNKVGGYDMMLAQNPVYIITGERGEVNEQAADCGNG